MTDATLLKVAESQKVYEWPDKKMGRGIT